MTTELPATGCNGELEPGEEAARAGDNVSALTGEAASSGRYMAFASFMFVFASATAMRASWMRLFL